MYIFPYDELIVCGFKRGRASSTFAFSFFKKYQSTLTHTSLFRKILKYLNPFFDISVIVSSAVMSIKRKGETGGLQTADRLLKNRNINKL